MQFESELRRLIREEVTRAFREASQAQPSGASAAAADELVSVTVAAAIGSYSPATIRKWIKAGQLRSYGEGRNVRVSRADLFAHLKRLALVPASSAPTEADIEERAISLVKGR